MHRFVLSVFTVGINLLFQIKPVVPNHLTIVGNFTYKNLNTTWTSALVVYTDKYKFTLEPFEHVQIILKTS